MDPGTYTFASCVVYSALAAQLIRSIHFKKWTLVGFLASCMLLNAMLFIARHPH